VGRNLARRMTGLGHQVVLISRGVDKRDMAIRQDERTTFKSIGTDNVEALAAAFDGCDAVAHLSGINREIGDQTYRRVHVEGTANVIGAAKRARVNKLVLLSFLRARPNCGSPYHESKWASEELVRNSELDYTIFKAGVIYGKGDQMLDHISHALHRFPVFLLVGFQPKPVRPLAVEDLVTAITGSILDQRLPKATVPITGPEEMDLRELGSRISRVCGKRRLILPAPVWVHYMMAWLFERTMAVPLTAFAQVRILSESLAEPFLAPDKLPTDLLPRTSFTDDQIRAGLPEPIRHGLGDCLFRSRRSVVH